MPEGPFKVSEMLEREIMTKSFFRVLVIIITISFSTISHANTKTATSILLFGDSIISGYKLAQFESLSHQLETILTSQGINVKVINGGVSGDTTGGGRNRIKWTLEKHKPDIIIIALGGNDLLRGFPTKVIRSNVESMLKTAQESGTFVILSEVEAPNNYGVQYQEEFNSIYYDLAKKYKVPLYPFLLKKINYRNSHYMQQDKIHPNADGAKKIAQDLADYLLKNMTDSDKKNNNKKEENDFDPIIKW